MEHPLSSLIHLEDIKVTFTPSLSWTESTLVYVFIHPAQDIAVDFCVQLNRTKFVNHNQSLFIHVFVAAFLILAYLRKSCTKK